MSMRRPRRGILRDFERVRASLRWNAFSHRYLNQPVLNMQEFPLMAIDGERKAADPLVGWMRGKFDFSTFQKKPKMDGACRAMPYIAVTAMAYLGGVAAAARNERTFRDTSFINNVLRQRMEQQW